MSSNALRGKRPSAKKASGKGVRAGGGGEGSNDTLGEEALKMEKLAEESAEGCPFCHYRKNTAGNKFIGDPTGRLILVDEAGAKRPEDVRVGVSSANAFPVANLHGLVFSGKHSIARLTRQDFRQMTKAAERWFEAAANAAGADAKKKKELFRVITMDSSPSGGASQIHPHMQMFVFERSWPARWTQIFEGAANFEQKTGGEKDFFQRLINVHLMLGLGVEQSQGVFVFAHLTPIKNGEIMVIDASDSYSSSSTTSTFFDAVFQVLKFLQSRGKYSFSLGIAMSRERGYGGTPLVARIVPRSPVDESYNDVSSFDLYLKSVISEDPFAVAKYLKEFFHK